jgi:hypothetical protein
MAEPTRSALELAALWAACLAMIGPDALLPGAAAVGHPTRDLFDHLALLDQWSLRPPEWTFPEGGSLVPPDLGGMLLAAPFLGLGRGTAWNAALLLQLGLACTAGWALGRRAGSGLVGGAAFGLSPFLLGEALSGEGETLSVWPLPLLVAALWAGGRAAAIGAGALGALAAVGSWYHGAFAAVLIALWTALVARPWRPDAPAGARWALPTFAALVAPPALAFRGVLVADDQLFRALPLRAYLDEHPRALAGMSTDIAAWWGRAGAGATHVDALGYLHLALAAIGALGLLRADRRQAAAWLGLVAGALLLAVGPVLHAGGARVFEWMPARALVDLPGFGLMRLTHRWTLLATLGLAVLAARGAQRTPWIAAAVLIFEVAWFWVPERPRTEISPPPLHAALRGPVLDLPPRSLGQDARGRYLLWQRAHGQPTPYSLLMTGWSPTLAGEPLVQAVSALDRRDPAPDRPAEARQFRQEAFALAVQQLRRKGLKGAALDGAEDRLRAAGFTELILHTDLLHPDDQVPVSTLLIEVLGPPDAQDDRGLLWRL